MKMNATLRQALLDEVYQLVEDEDNRDHWALLLQEQETPDGDALGDELEQLVRDTQLVELAHENPVIRAGAMSTQQVEAECRRLHPEWFFTLNRVPIVDGLRVWDYDVKPGAFDFEESFRGQTPEYWDGWFKVKVDGGNGHSLMNGERTTTFLSWKGEVPPAPTEVTP
jgi:hypothetical protein